MNKKIEFPNNKVIKQYHGKTKKSNSGVYILTISGKEIECSSSELSLIIKEYENVSRVQSHVCFSELAQREVGPYYSEQFKDEVSRVLTAFPNEFTFDDISSVLGLYYMQTKDKVDNWRKENIVGGSDNKLRWLIKNVDEIINPVFTDLP